MQILHQLITFGASPQAITVGPSGVYRIRAEPASGNSHDCFVLAADVLSGASGNTDGVLKVIAKPPASNSGTPLDAFDFSIEKGANPVHTNQFLFDGTSGEKVRVSIFVF